MEVKPISKISPLSSRRDFLRNSFVALAGATSLPNLNLLHAQEANPAINETKPEPGELAKKLGYEGATNEELARTAGRDLRMNILNSLDPQEFLKRTSTARVSEDSLGYVDDLYELAAYQIKEKGAGQAVNILNDIEKFGKEIKSARLATLIAQATIAELRIKSQDSKGKLITSLSGLLEPIDIFLNLNYRKMSPMQKIQVENTILEAIYGKRAINFLLKKLPISTQYDPKLIKDLIKEVNEIKAKPAVILEESAA